MKKVRVRIIESIGGLADPKAPEQLQAKYDQMRREMEAKEKPPSKATIDAVINSAKLRDRFGETPVGFSRDWAFKPGDEPAISEDLAAKWEECGICVLVSPEKRKEAA